MKKKLPSLAYKLCVNGGLIAGSQAKKLVGEKVKPKDWDILVPPEKWQAVALLIPKSAKLNSFGGWSFEDSHGTPFDVWCDTMQNYLTNCKSTSDGAVVLVDFIHDRVYSAYTRVV